MKVLVDTNILLRSVQRQNVSCRTARGALMDLYRKGHDLYITTQNVAEFWNVCTRPAKVNGLGLTVEATNRFVNQLEKLFTILPDSLDVFREWRRLVFEYSVLGLKVHDTRLVATMISFRISHILTFNGSDFARFGEVQVIDPDKQRGS